MGFCNTAKIVEENCALNWYYECYQQPLAQAFGQSIYDKFEFFLVGKPIHLKKTDDFSEEMVESIHKNFTEELIALFEEHKHKYIENADDIHLEITE